MNQPVVHMEYTFSAVYSPYMATNSFILENALLIFLICGDAVSLARVFSRAIINIKSFTLLLVSHRRKAEVQLISQSGSW